MAFILPAFMNNWVKEFRKSACFNSHINREYYHKEKKGNGNFSLRHLRQELRSFI